MNHPPRYPGPLPLDLAQRDAGGLAIMHREINDAIDAAYWRFTRTARGAPPPGELYARRTWITEALIRARSSEDRV